jgi:Predicted nucleic acid-binding protein, contains PIN domain
VILVDTSVWIDHFRRSEPGLVALLESDAVLTHPFVVGELACGHMRNRDEILRLFLRLPAAPVASHAETLEFIEKRSLMGRGVGYVDVQLLASVALATSARLWTRNKPLASVAGQMKVAYEV